MKKWNLKREEITIYSCCLVPYACYETKFDSGLPV